MKKTKYKKVFSMTGELGLRNYTVRDIIDLKGEKQLTQTLPFIPNEAKTAEKISASIESGIVSVNQPWMPVVEVPFGGIKDSGYGKELGTEGLEAYLQSKFITQKSSI